MKMNAALLAYTRPKENKTDPHARIAELKKLLSSLPRPENEEDMKRELIELQGRYEPAHTCIEFPNLKCQICGQ